MKVVKEISEVREFTKQDREKTVGFVPTMGYLHQGHLALLEQAREENDIVVLSIFVNPTQFGPDEDYEDYPRDLERDLELARSAGVDLVFTPKADKMYSDNAATKVEVTGLTGKLCGASRDGHFSGVCTVVSKLFNIVNPTRAYFGQKDYQQVLVIKRMVEDLNFDLDIVTVPIVREEDGLAISSRNKYLNQAERKAALVLFESLQRGKELIVGGERKAKVIEQELISNIEAEPLAEIDYVAVVDASSLKDIDKIRGEVLLALAVYIGETRLIDNLIVEV
ncbi:pantoate--beta-alanine ligase [Natroniella sulfidigena]|uniref:pantoate--beta-alanine ligase n=1 Tax=Natroniella sulfidigena TaxID=723921 RepID=UPI00200B50E7|nr:pantoate--beta-alanine ligase [Natroniella sulfidigena]